MNAPLVSPPGFTVRRCRRPLGRHTGSGLSARPAAAARLLGRALAVGLTLIFSCACKPFPQDRPEPPADDQTPLRVTRVLLAGQATEVRVRAPGELTVTDDLGALIGTYPKKKWVTVDLTADGALKLAGGSVAGGSITVRTALGQCLSLSVDRKDGKTEDRCYPGAMRVDRNEDGRIRVVNLVDVEQYVGCVVAGEVWPTFEDEAFRAQAIVARTFLLYQMERRQEAAYDVKATQSSQVYRGIRDDRTGLRAAEAAKKTRGLVCTWRDGERDRLFSTYYSAACGGLSQSAAIFGQADDVPPLSGGVKCDYCRIAPGDSYRWGPVRMPVEEVHRKLTARYPGLASFGRVTDIDVIEQTPAGRPVRLRLTGSGGDKHEMLVEHFRLALGGSVIRSTDCDMSVTGKHVIFKHGRGFGHGLGLCQWGMQGQALDGKTAPEILRFYYPGSKLTRVY